MFETVKADIYIMVDVDDTYPTDRIYDLLNPVIDDGADRVIGSRIAQSKQGNNVNGFKPLNLPGNLIYRKMINWIFKSDLSDILSGYRVINNQILKTIPLHLQGLEVEIALTLNAIVPGFRIKEIPIELSDRPKGSKLKARILKDGIRILRTIILFFRDYKPLFFLEASGLLILIIGLIIGLIDVGEYLSTGLVSRFPLAILSVGFVLSSIIWIIASIILHTIDRRFQEVESSLISIWK
jgi:hypothetical protein